jgi:hypothetical protein
LSCLISARYSPRYLIPLVWVVLSAAPLLVTTGVSVNRLVLGLSGDALIVGAGISVLLALISAILPKGSERVVRGLILVSAAAFVAYAVTVYFNDYRLLPQI